MLNAGKQKKSSLKKEKRKQEKECLFLFKKEQSAQVDIYEKSKPGALTFNHACLKGSSIIPISDNI